MNKKFIKRIIIILIMIFLGVIEYKLYKKYKIQKMARESIIKENTKKIEKAFLFRKEDFFKDKRYIKKYSELNVEEIEEN